MALELLDGLLLQRRGLGRRPDGRRRRILARHAAVAALVVGAMSLAACNPVLNLTVDTAADGSDVNPGDGQCATAGGGCSLRAAIDEANATPGFDRITIQPGVDPVLSLPGAAEDSNLSGDLDVTGNLDIVGNGATIDAAAIDRVFEVSAGRLSVIDATVTGGNVPAGTNGSAFSSTGELWLDHVTVEGNQGLAIDSAGTSVFLADSEVDSSEGGSAASTGIRVSSGTLTMARSLVVAEGAGGSMPALRVDGAQSALTMLDSTVRSTGIAISISSNATGASGNIVRSTVANSGWWESAWVIEKPSSVPVEVSASIVQSLSPGPWTAVCSSPVTSGGYNVVSDASCGANASGDKVQAALLGPLADHGGPTRTMVPFAGSPAVDRVPLDGPLCPFVPLDQRSVPRPSGTGCDSGAVEGVGPVVNPLSFTVDSSSDAVDVAPGDGVCASGAGECTLRAAVMETNSSGADLTAPFFNSISIADGVDPVLSIEGADEDAAASGDLDVGVRVRIHGNDATVYGNQVDRILDVHTSNMIVENLALEGGSVTGDGGAVRSRSGNLDLVDVTVSDSTATGDGGAIWATGLRGALVDVTGNAAGSDGGGIYASDLWLEQMNVAGNSAAHNGGGVMIDGRGLITSSAITGNSAQNGGGLAADEVNGHLKVADSTVADNSAASFGYSEVYAMGLFAPSLELVRSTISGSDTDSLALITQGSHCTPFGCAMWPSVVASGSIITGGSGKQVCNKPLTSDSSFILSPDPAANCGPSLPGTGALAPLANNGGPTATKLPLPGSGAQNVIPIGTPGLCDPQGSYDQRGVIRPVGPACDVGAVEQ
ncbi:MAG: CSLREA domain-containing protein [Acidimicrobiales bacterium]|nr:CSLREA domain-containing protein [Acidimicrobiales bacterium]